MAEGRSYFVCKFGFNALSFAACVNVFVPNFTVPGGFASLYIATVAPPGDLSAISRYGSKAPKVDRHRVEFGGRGFFYSRVTCISNLYHSPDVCLLLETDLGS